MPYPNFHACRVKSPSLFKKGSLRTLNTKTKGLTFISGKLKSNDKSAVQAYRYKKTDWPADRARTHCSKHNGKFETARTRKALSLHDNEKDYLMVDEINPEVVKEISLSFLYRTHMKIHNETFSNDNMQEVSTAHKIIADEMLDRGLLHHQWDKLDTVYQ